MKKKIIRILGVVLLVLCITGCKSEELNSIDLEKSKEEISSKMSGMSDADTTELKDIYGVDVSLFGEYIFQVSDASNGDIYAIIYVDDENVEEVKQQMSSYFTTLEDQVEMYSPDVVSKIKNRLETSIGNYLIYISSTDNQGIYDIIKENTK